jgi:hypothetical protein
VLLHCVLSYIVSASQSAALCSELRNKLQLKTIGCTISEKAS